MDRRFVKLAVVTICGIVVTTVAPKAICVEASLEEQFASSAVVFVGRATAQEVETATETILSPARTVRWKRTVTTFEAEEVWKGTSDKTVHVRTCGVNEGDCSDTFAFQVGKTYLVFAGGEPLQTSWCVPTALLEEAGRTLQWLVDKPRITVR